MNNIHKSLAKSLARIQQPQTIREQFINNIMRDGKKTRATNIIDSLVEPFEEAIKLAAPLVKIKTVRKGKRNIQMPVPLTEKQRYRVAIKWIQGEAEKHKMPFSLALDKELHKIVQGQSPILQKREQMHKQALQNRSNLVLVDRKR